LSRYGKPSRRMLTFLDKNPGSTAREISEYLHNHRAGKIRRGRFAYLTTPYHSRTLAGDPSGRTTHPGAANRSAQRRWFYRTKNKDNIYVYFLTLKGMQALKEHGLK